MEARKFSDKTGLKIVVHTGAVKYEQANVLDGGVVHALLHCCNATGKVSDEWFIQLSHKYEVERLNLKGKISELRKKLSESGKSQKEREDFIYAVRQFMQMNGLTAPLLRELIDHIDVFETEGTGKNRTQRIVIYYRFVGYVEIPDSPHKPHYKADTRQGVAVEYLTEPKAS